MPILASITASLATPVLDRFDLARAEARLRGPTTNMTRRH
jgi:hypothetical protein